MKKIISIIGARPQFIKHAPIQLQLQKHYNSITLHTGQHYDKKMSQIFFEDLKMPRPDHHFNIGAISLQGAQTAIIIKNVEHVCVKEKPDAIILYGDTNSTLAGAIVAAKLLIPIIHIEAGLRSFNRSMPEEINRIIADEFSFLLFCPSVQAIENLKKEGIVDNVFLTGDIMCDALHLVKDKIKRKVNYPYFYTTIHRPYNTDDPERLKSILETLNKLDKKVIFSLHPRTKSKLESVQLSSYGNINFIDPVGYIDSLSYQQFAQAIITDSGGIQKEAYMLKTKCITLRSETEWIETLENNWNTLVFENLDMIHTVVNNNVGDHFPKLYGNGNAAEEIVEIIKAHI